MRECGGLPSVWSAFAALSGRFASVRAVGDAVLLSRFVFDHACCLSFDKQDGLRDVAFLYRRVEIAIRAFSGCWRGYLPLWVHFGLAVCLRRSRRDYRGRGERGNGGTRLAARPLCSFAQAHWPCRSFRREYAGAARPRLRQRVFDSLDSLHAAAGLCWCGFAAPSPGYMERPARL